MNVREAWARRPVVWPYFPFLVISLATLALTTWAALVSWAFPYDGMQWSAQTGHIETVDAHGPAAQAGIRGGDRILALDGIPLADVYPLYRGKRAGDQALLTLLRAERQRAVSLTLAAPPPRVRAIHLEPLLVGLSFWLVGLVVWALRPFHSVTRLFFLLSQAATGMLAAGDLSTIRLPWAIRLFSLFLLLLAPLTLHFYASFPDPLARRYRRPLLRLAYGAAGFLALVYLLRTLPPADLLGPASLPVVRNALVALTLLAALALLLLFRARRTATLQAQRRRRLLIAGMLLSLIPLLFLSFLPELLRGFPLLDYVWTFPFLILFPLSYAYAVHQGELGRIDLILNRSLVYFVLTALLLSLYGLLFLGLDLLLPAMPWSRPLASAALAVVAAALFGPLRARLQRWVDRLFYGGWYDYRTVVRETSRELSRTLDLERLSAWLLDIARTLRFQAAALLWPAGADDSTVRLSSPKSELPKVLVPHGSFGYQAEALELLRLPMGGALAQHLSAVARTHWRAQISRELAADELTEGEKALLAEERVHFWLPLVSRGRLRGVLVMGARPGEELLDAEDLDILATLAGQAAVAAENVALIEALRAQLVEVKQARDELAETRRRLAESREAERLHLAQELHDGPVQDLYGTRFRLAVMAEEIGNDASRMRLATAQGELLRVIDELRATCQELRPPALVPFGLEAAIRSHAGRFQKAHPELEVQVDLMHDGQALPERVRLALFRICQEALGNVARHADASCVLIRFYLNEERILLEISDDGCGFEVPERWILLARRGCLGLLGAAERADSTGGRLEVASAPGQGTVVRVVTPRREEWFECKKLDHRPRQERPARPQTGPRAR